MNEHASTWEWLERLNFRLSIHDRDFARRSKHELSGGRTVLHLHHSAQSVIRQSFAVDGGRVAPVRVPVKGVRFGGEQVAVGIVARRALTRNRRHA